MFIRLKSARKTATKSLKTVRICPILVDLEHKFLELQVSIL